jgi:predicted RNA-binding protein with PUA domain
MIKLSMYGKWKDRFYWCDDCNLRVPKLKSGGMGGGFINHMLLMLYHKPGCKGKY